MKRHSINLFFVWSVLAVFSYPNSLWAIDNIQQAAGILQFSPLGVAAGMTILRRDSVGAVQLAESVALTEGVTVALKYTIHERRPNGRNNHSFPSGHTSFAFSSAEFLRERYGWEYGIPAYAVAT
jgi:membrane-associated phospholipid phosphatase